MPEAGDGLRRVTVRLMAARPTPGRNALDAARYHPWCPKPENADQRQRLEQFRVGEHGAASSLQVRADPADAKR